MLGGLHRWAHVPWSHCDNPRILDDEVCPTCKGKKLANTVNVEATRVFAIGKAIPTVVVLQAPDGLPIPGEPFEARMPDGEAVKGKTDANGKALIKGKKKGECQVRFEHWYAHDFEVATPFVNAVAEAEAPVASAPAAPWLAFQLVDDEDRPVPFARYRVRFTKDGRAVEGTTDEEGRAYLVAPAEGVAEVAFEGFASCDFESAPLGPTPLPPGPIGATPAPAPPSAPWIEVVLEDEHGAPVPFHPFEVRLGDDDATTRGTLDERGRARVLCPKAGQVRVAFPGLSSLDLESSAPLVVAPIAPAREADGTSAPPPLEWIDLELRDADDRPVPFHPWRIQPPGERPALSGALDEMGRARVNVPGAAACKVSFPGLYTYDFHDLAGDGS